MDTNSTLNHLILYLYNETWLADSVLIQHEIDSDPVTEMKFENLKESLGFLNGLEAEPSEKSLKRIFEAVS